MAKYLDSHTLRQAATALIHHLLLLLAFITVLRWGPEHSGIPEVPSGSKSSISPPLDHPVAERIWPDDDWSEYDGEAAYTITGECERLFCDLLSAKFLGEKGVARQGSLVMDAYQASRPNYTREDYKQIQKWIEVWNYPSDSIYRGFVADMHNERTLFVFFNEDVMTHGLKSGLIALFELASTPAFCCSQMIACVRRLQDGTEMEVVRSLGWCGFSLTTLAVGNPRASRDVSLSSKWLFLSAEI
ncbi:hypothetical protein MAP00_008664 [Monascus purpureus]|nr:hypothetical protein MAP00_008664 [Monascus purpureus]